MAQNSARMRSEVPPLSSSKTGPHLTQRVPLVLCLVRCSLKLWRRHTLARFVSQRLRIVGFMRVSSPRRIQRTPQRYTQPSSRPTRRSSLTKSSACYGTSRVAFASALLPTAATSPLHCFEVLELDGHSKTDLPQSMTWAVPVKVSTSPDSTRFKHAPKDVSSYSMEDSCDKRHMARHHPIHAQHFTVRSHFTAQLPCVRLGFDVWRRINSSPPFFSRHETM